MKRINPIAALLVVSLLLSPGCTKNEIKNVTISGKAQKGPFQIGTTITINELNPELKQTGKSYTSTIDRNDGSFALNDVALGENYALLTATGYYFGEVHGFVTRSPLTLQSIVDVSAPGDVNINVLTHIVKPRIERLVQDGNTLSEAKSLAEIELITILTGDAIASAGLERLDITNGSAVDGILLAFSVLTDTKSPESLTSFLSNFRTEFASEGTLENVNMMKELIDRWEELDGFMRIRSHLTAMYSDLSLEPSIPNFEHHIDRMVEMYGDVLYSDFFYPKEAMMYPDQPDTSSYVDNLLALEGDTILIQGDNVNPDASLYVGIPLYSKVSIKITPLNGRSESCVIYQKGWYIDGVPFNPHEFTSQSVGDGLTVHSQCTNRVTSLGINFNQSQTKYSIEVFENDSHTPSITKVVNFTGGEGWD